MRFDDFCTHTFGTCRASGALRLARLLPLMLLGACTLFDESLITGGTLAEVCGSTAPMVTENTSIMVDTSRMLDDLNSEVAGCIGQASPGNDGFFGVEMQAGEKWHFHIRNNAGTGTNPSLYILNGTCDDRTCQPGDAIDVCGSDRDEHLSFVPPTSGVFYVGIDGREAGGGVYSVEVWRPECGNGVLEHSEGCDNATDTSCDAECRHVALDGEVESEPNDDFSSANVALSALGTTSLRGQLVDLCDLDMYMLDLPDTANATLTATITDNGGAACGDSAPEVELELLDESGVRVLGNGTVGGAGGTCPSIEGAGFATGVSGRVYLRVTTTAAQALFNYRIAITAASAT